MNSDPAHHPPPPARQLSVLGSAPMERSSSAPVRPDLSALRSASGHGRHAAGRSWRGARHLTFDNDMESDDSDEVFEEQPQDPSHQDMKIRARILDPAIADTGDSLGTSAHLTRNRLEQLTVGPELATGSFIQILVTPPTPDPTFPVYPANTSLGVTICETDQESGGFIEYENSLEAAYADIYGGESVMVTEMEVEEEGVDVQLGKGVFMVDEHQWEYVKEEKAGDEEGEEKDVDGEEAEPLAKVRVSLVHDGMS